MPRMTFLEPMQKWLKDNLLQQGLREEDIDDCIKKWNDGRDAVGPIQLGIYQVFQQVQVDFEAQCAEDDEAAREAEDA